jgi:methanogen homoaconitase small subunit
MPRLWIFGDDVSTDAIVPGRYAPYVTSDEELRQYAFVEARPEFAKEVQPGDVLAAGPNFGCGSSREYAAEALRRCELGAIVAPSFARIFYRNAVNLGLALFEADVRLLGAGAEVRIDVDSGRLAHAAGSIELPRPSALAREIRRAGGLVRYFREHGRFPGEVPA